MITFFLIIGRFIRSVFYGLRDPEFRTLLAAVSITLVGGTFFMPVSRAGTCWTPFISA
jgi:hypothetical protein